METKRSRVLDLGFALGLALSALLLAAFWAVPYLPMVDFPQHAAQISIWQRLADPGAPTAGLFELNLRTPYLGAYFMARVLAPWLGTVPALKFVVWAAVVGHFAAFDLLVRTLRHPRWLSLLGLPLGLGYGFYFGFVSFIAAIPFGLLAMSAAWRHREQPTLLRGALLALALCATLGNHGFAFGMTLAVVGPLLLRGSGSIVARGAPLAVPALLILVWLAPGSSAKSIGYTIWDPRFRVLAEVPALMLAASAADVLASVFGGLMLLLVLLSLGSFSRQPERLAPLVFLVLGYCLFPLSLGGFGPLYPRFAAFMVPGLLIAFEPRQEDEQQSVLPGLIAATCAAWIALVVHRLASFEQETRPVTDFIALMPVGLSIRPIVFERTSDVFPALPTFLHMSAYYVPEKAGRQGYSFAMYPTSVIRYARGVGQTMDGGAEWHPETFSAHDELDQYDCFLVHSRSDRSLELFGERTPDVSLAFHEADWWAYLNRSALGTLRTHDSKGSKHEQPLVFSSSK